MFSNVFLIIKKDLEKINKNNKFNYNNFKINFNKLDDELYWIFI